MAIGAKENQVFDGVNNVTAAFSDWDQVVGLDEILPDTLIVLLETVEGENRCRNPDQIIQNQITRY